MDTELDLTDAAGKTANCQITSEPTQFVHVFSAPFLPRRLWITEPGPHAHPLVEFAPGNKLKTTVKCNALTRSCGQGRQPTNELVHERPGSTIVVFEQNGVSAFALNNRRDVGVALRALKDHKIALPMPEFLSLTDAAWPVLDCNGIWKGVATCFARVSRDTFPASGG